MAQSQKVTVSSETCTLCSHQSTTCLTVKFHRTSGKSNHAQLMYFSNWNQHPLSVLSSKDMKIIFGKMWIIWVIQMLQTIAEKEIQSVVTTTSSVTIWICNASIQHIMSRKYEKCGNCTRADEKLVSASVNYPNCL
jgi:hypothetical protein